MLWCMDEEITTIRSDGDLLSYIPYTMGFLPEQSVVIMALTADTVELMARFDIRAEVLTADATTLRKYAEHVHRVFHGATAISPEAQYAVVLYLDTEERLDEIRQSFHDAFSLNCDHSGDDCRILTMLHVGAEHWQVLYADGTRSDAKRLHAGVDAHSAVNASMVYGGQTYAPNLGSLTDRLFDGVPELAATNIAAELSKALSRPIPERWDREYLSMELERWERALAAVVTGGQSAFDPQGFDPAAARAALSRLEGELLAGLYASLRSIQIRDALLVQCFFGHECADLTVRVINTPYIVLAAQILDRGEDGDVSVLEDIEDVDGLCVEDRLQAKAMHHHAMDLYGQIFTGQGLGETEPFHEFAELRLAALTLILKTLYSLPESESDPAILTLLAWESWRRGRGSVAGCYLDRALGQDPDYNLARIQLQMIEHGINFDRTSYQPPAEADHWAS